MLHCVVTKTSSLTPKKCQNSETTSKYEGKSNEKCASEEFQNREKKKKEIMQASGMIIVAFCCCFSLMPLTY